PSCRGGGAAPRARDAAPAATSDGRGTTAFKGTLMEQPAPPPVIRDLPWLGWLFGLVLGGFAVVPALFTALDLLASPARPASFPFAVLLVAALFGVGSLLLFSLSSVLTVRVERDRGALTLTYRSLLRKTVKEIPLQQIASIDIEVFSGGRGPSYRVVITQ